MISYRVLGFFNFSGLPLPPGLLVGHQESHPQVVPVAVSNHFGRHLFYPLSDDVVNIVVVDF